MELPFCGIFFHVTHQQLNSNKFKDFKTFKYCTSSIKTFKLNTVEHRRMKKLDSEFELWKFELTEFPCEGLLVNSERNEEFVRFRCLFELYKFELPELNCSLGIKISLSKIPLAGPLLF